ncbi:uncharacterized protein LOC144449560 [Glandiceps talaboti]
MEAIAKELAAVYGCNYPLRLIRDLGDLCRTNYRGDVENMRTGYLVPTKKLLGQLKAMGVPLIKDNKVIIHLFAPVHALSVGEFIFQVSKTFPGELAMKFTKFVTQDGDRNELPRSQWKYEVENSLVDEDELKCFYSLAFLEEKRRIGRFENKTMRTSVNFRLCVVDDVDSVNCDVVDADSIMPEYTENGMVEVRYDAKLVERIDNLPNEIKDLKTGQIRELAKKLDNINVTSGDYQTLADNLGYTWNDIKERFKKAASPTQEIITALQEEQPNYTIATFVDVLRNIGRNDAVSAMCEIEEKRRNSRGSREELNRSPVQEIGAPESTSQHENHRIAVESDDMPSRLDALPVKESREGAASDKHPDVLQNGCRSGNGGDSFHKDLHCQCGQPQTSDFNEEVTVVGNITSNRGDYIRSTVGDMSHRERGINEPLESIDIHSKSDETAENKCVQSTQATSTSSTISNAGVVRRNGYVRGSKSTSFDQTTTGIEAQQPVAPITNKYVRK